MLKRITLVVTVLAVVALGAVGVMALAGGQTALAEDESTSTSVSSSAMLRHITVVGEGKVSVVPDIATLQVGVETKAPEVTQAMDDNDEIMANILEALDEAGVAEEDIRTSQFSIFFDEGFRGPDIEQEPVYRVSNMVTVIVRDLESVGNLLDAAVEAGANRVYGVNFTVEDWSEAEFEARELAVADARERAEHLAELVDVEVGEVISISEVIGAGVVPTPMAVMERAVGLGGGAPIVPGQQEVTTRIQVTFAIE